MADILIAFGSSEESAPLNPKKVEESLDELLQRERRPAVNLRCHVLNTAWVIRVTDITVEDVARKLSRALPINRPLIVVELAGDWKALNGATPSGRCFSW